MQVQLQNPSMKMRLPQVWNNYAGAESKTKALILSFIDAVNALFVLKKKRGFVFSLKSEPKPYFGCSKYEFLLSK